MPEITDASQRRRSWVDRLVIGLLVGATVVAVGSVALLTVYLNRITEAAAAIHRVDSLGSYDGRPAAVAVDGVSPRNFLLTATGSDGNLDAIVIAHLSASRRNLTLVAVPVDLRVSPQSSTLATAYASDPLPVQRDLELLTGARMDHQVRVALEGLVPVVDALGGVDLDGAALNGSAVVAGLTATPPTSRSLASAKFLRAALERSAYAAVIADPTRFDRLLDALTPCLKVDATLTPDEIQATMVESRVHPEEIAVTELAVVRSGSGSQPDPAALADLRDAFATDHFADAGLPAATPSPTPSR